MPMIHNKSKSKIIYPKGWQSDGKTPLMDASGKKALTEFIDGGAHKQMTDEQYAHVKANCPHQVINVDNMKDLQLQFPEKAQEKPRQGYLSPEEVEVAKKLAVDAAFAAAGIERGVADDTPTNTTAKTIDAAPAKAGIVSGIKSALGMGGNAETDQAA